MGKDEAIRFRQTKRRSALTRLAAVGAAILLSAALSRANDQAPARPAPTEKQAVPTARYDLRERYWGELYFQAEYSHHDRHNVVGDLWTKHGLHLLKIGDSWFDAYIKARLYADRNADYWNNRTEGALGLRYRPSSKLGLFLFAEWIEGAYTGRHGRDANLDDDPYSDFQTGFTFWQYWGNAHWQVAQGWHFYAPFFGWREAYADAIFYRRDNRNLIATLDYKEGLLLAKVADVRLDAYLSLQAGADKNSDYWNNYLKAGPGIRVRPFEKIDVSLSCEYLFCHTWRGETLEEPANYRDIAVTLAFWKGF